MMASTVLSEQGQLVIPAEIRKQMGLRRGDRFLVETNKDGLVLKLQPRNPLLELRGAFKGGDDDVLAELIAEHAADREREDAR